MRLLNLWPDAARTRQAVRTSFSQELAGLVLLSAIIVLAALFYLRHQTAQVDAVNAVLQQQLGLITPNADSTRKAMPDKQYTDVRLRSAGQLNWLAYLPDLIDADTQLTRVIQKDGALHIFGRSTSAAHMQAFLARLKNLSDTAAPVLASFENQSTGLNAGWYFEVRVNETSLEEGAR
jgi:Tfp pilus assembly protein PilN